MRHTNYTVKYLNVALQSVTDKTMEDCYIGFHGPMIAFYREEQDNRAKSPQGTFNDILLWLIPMTQLISVEEVQNARIRSLSS